MKKALAVILVVWAAGALPAQSPAGDGNVAEISFIFVRQNAGGSNQFAVWIEDAAGQYVRTVYATRYTARGGWRYRAASLPLWVRQSGVARMERPGIDALTGATPLTGRQTFRWDGKDERGAPAPRGEYRLILEATLRNENYVLYTAVIRIGGSPGAAAVQYEYFGDRTTERGMIEQVTVRSLR